MHHFIRQPDGNHFLSRIDPRVKLLCALALLAMVLSAASPVFPLLTAALCVALCLSLGAGPKAVAIRFAEPGLIIAMVILLKLFFSGHAPLFSLSLFGLEITAYREGLREGLLIAGRIAGAVSVASALGFATRFTELMAALAWLRVPRSFIEIALFAWRYLFLLFEDAGVIHAAQKNRLGYTGWRQGLRSFGALTGSLIIKAFDGSRGITTAMVQRGYDGNMPMLRHKPFRMPEVAAGVIFLLGMGLLWKI